MWDHRNRINNDELSSEDRRQLRLLRNQVHHQFKLGTSTLLPSERWMLSDKYLVVQYPLDSLRGWVGQVQAGRAAHQRVQDAIYAPIRRQQVFMANWMHPHS